ncbi:hypothetical protein [Streptomyces sp. 6N223]|uniref:hypothetical protein n=1 Tax=Streptomyces sp. 6N223 TaxID=3457412 RepID=UPI003FD6003E
MPGDLQEHQVINYHESFLVQERVETLRREAERERLAAEIRRSRRERDRSAKKEREKRDEEKRQGRAEGRAGGRMPGRRRTLRWGAGA